ncbi:unnamed protein product [Closterium sp. Yama58-4]|nr:unnamed protein product [Closterium sp. Yama58-4]
MVLQHQLLLLLLERWVQRALALAWCVAVLQLATPVALVNAQLLEESQVQFLQDCQTAWGQTLPGWGDPNPDCSSAQGITCDSNGMVLVMHLPELNLSGSIPDSISSLRELSLLYALKGPNALVPEEAATRNRLQQMREEREEEGKGVGWVGLGEQKAEGRAVYEGAHGLVVGYRS